MAEPLKKHKETGERYERPPLVEANIDGALREDPKGVERRLLLTDRKSPEYLRTECLVHLVRHLTRTNDERLRDSIVTVLLGRCEGILRSKIVDSYPNAAILREDILGEFALLLARDGTGDNPYELDYFEVRFNHAFRTFRIDLLRSSEDEFSESVSLPAESRGREEDVPRSTSEAPSCPATQEEELAVADLLAQLPSELRQAFVLCHHLGYEIESNDPNKVTAATLCKVSGRTLRDRLKKAKEFLSRSL